MNATSDTRSTATGSVRSARGACTDPGTRPFQARRHADGGAQRVTFRRLRPASGNPARPRDQECARAVLQHHVDPAGAVLAQPPYRLAEPARHARGVLAERQDHRPDLHPAAGRRPARRPSDHGRPGPERCRQHRARAAPMTPPPVSHRQVTPVVETCHVMHAIRIMHFPCRTDSTPPIDSEAPGRPGRTGPACRVPRTVCGIIDVPGDLRPAPGAPSGPGRATKSGTVHAPDRIQCACRGDPLVTGKTAGGGTARRISVARRFVKRAFRRFSPDPGGPSR